MKYFLYLFIFIISLNIYSKNWISFESEMLYIKTLKSTDYKNIHNGLALSFDIGSDFYIKGNISTNINFDKLSKAQIGLSWMYEFYFFDIHPFIGYEAGYYFLNDVEFNHLIYAKLNGGVLFHLYNLWKRLKTGTELSIYSFIGTNKYIAISVSGVFFVKVEF